MIEILVLQQHFFQELFDSLGTKLSFSTANHPQTDGLTERMKKTVEDIWRAFVNHKQDNWDILLPFCEFSINNSVEASTAQTPFFLNYGLNPRCPADLLSNGATNSLSRNWIEERNDAIKIAQDSIVAAQARQALYYDGGRAPAELKVGQKVMVFREFMVSPEARNQKSHKLRPKWFGPYVVTAKVGTNAYRLKFPHILHCHPVFNVTALKLYEQNQIPNRKQATPPPVTDLDGHTRYIVDGILNHRKIRNRIQYLVK